MEDREWALMGHEEGPRFSKAGPAQHLPDLRSPPLPFSSAKNADAEMDSQLREVINPHMHGLLLRIPGPACFPPRTVQVSLIRDKDLHRNREGPCAR